ncbi:uncharacterized protein METZ01_LOCUS213610, partial [marine metagenome]
NNARHLYFVGKGRCPVFPSAPINSHSSGA